MAYMTIDDGEKSLTHDAEKFFNLRLIERKGEFILFINIPLDCVASESNGNLYVNLSEVFDEYLLNIFNNLWQGAGLKAERDRINVLASYLSYVAMKLYNLRNEIQREEDMR